MKAEIKVPAVGESITEATIAEWVKSNGDWVERDEILLSLETDKASVEVVAENAGVLEISVEEGETVDIGAVIGKIDTEAQKPAGAGSAAAAGAPEAAAPAAVAAAAPQTNGAAHAAPPEGLSPAVRKAVAEKGIDPSSLAGTGRGGRLTKADVMGAPTGGATQTATTPAPASAPAQPLPTMPTVDFGEGEEKREKMTSLRKTIARRLVEAQQTAAILTTFNEIDMSNSMALRKRYKEMFEKRYGIKLGFMGLFTKACVEALKAFPKVNAYMDGDEIVYHNYVNMGIAVSTPKGLLVPVIRHADKLSLAEIELSIMHYAAKARDGKIAIDDLAGGTFTISNGGVFGSMMSTPILNPPQSGILGLHKIEQRPVAIDGEVKVRPMMYVALSYDHRMVDGKESVSFLVRVKEMMEDPSRILLEV